MKIYLLHGLSSSDFCTTIRARKQKNPEVRRLGTYTYRSCTLYSLEPCIPWNSIQIPVCISLHRRRGDGIVSLYSIYLILFVGASTATPGFGIYWFRRENDRPLLKVLAVGMFSLMYMLGNSSLRASDEWSRRVQKQMELETKEGMQACSGSGNSVVSIPQHTIFRCWVQRFDIHRA